MKTTIPQLVCGSFLGAMAGLILLLAYNTVYNKGYNQGQIDCFNGKRSVEYVTNTIVTIKPIVR